MALIPGTRFGVYEVTAHIAFAHDADRLARFQREARTLASLNHPNIAELKRLLPTK